MNIFSTIWGLKGAKMITIVAGTIAALAGAVTAAHKAWPLVEPAVPAHRGYVVQQISDVRQTANQLLIWKFEDAKERAERDAASAEILLRKERDEEVQKLIRRQIEDSQRRAREYEQRILTIK